MVPCKHGMQGHQAPALTFWWQHSMAATHSQRASQLLRSWCCGQEGGQVIQQ